MKENEPPAPLHSSGSATPPGPTASPQPQPSVDLHINELVLNGFAAADRHAIGDAVERELARLFAERGIPQSIRDEIEIADIRADAIALERGLDAETIGSKLAKALYGELSR
jgi:hypothetical protein